MSLLAVIRFTIVFTTLVARGLSIPPSDDIVGSQFPISLTPVLDNHVRVPITLGVMSRCADTLLCESLFDRVLRHTSGIVDMSLSFVGKCVYSTPPHFYGMPQAPDAS